MRCSFECSTLNKVLFLVFFPLKCDVLSYCRCWLSNYLLSRLFSLFDYFSLFIVPMFITMSLKTQDFVDTQFHFNFALCPMFMDKRHKTVVRDEERYVASSWIPSPDRLIVLFWCNTRRKEKWSWMSASVSSRSTFVSTVVLHLFNSSVSLQALISIFFFVVTFRGIF